MQSIAKGEKLKEEMGEIFDEIDSVLERTPRSSSTPTSRRGGVSDTSSDLPVGGAARSELSLPEVSTLASGGRRRRPARTNERCLNRGAEVAAARAPGCASTRRPLRSPPARAAATRRSVIARSYLLGAMPSAKETPVKPDPTLVR